MSFLKMAKVQRAFVRSLVLVALVCLLLAPAHAQLGTKLVATGAAGVAEQGDAVSTSSDGNTMIVGGPNDNGGTGAVWTFSRSGGAWTQGGKLPGSGGQFGAAVAMSADGNTAVVGAPYYNGNIGGVWIFKRSGGSWSYQAGPLVASDYSGSQGIQGYAVAISSDGNTVAVGGPGDRASAGSVWVWTRPSGGTTWTQQGNRLAGSDASYPSFLGDSVGLSGDGNTLIVGASSDNNYAGAAWIFTRSGATWTQAGSKLVGTGATNPSGQGVSVAISSDATTAIVGGCSNNNNTGAVWIFTQSIGNWSQQAGPLVGTGAAGAARQGVAVAISSDGNKAIVGGPNDAGNVGASWLFVRLFTSWSQSGGKVTALDASGTPAQGAAVAMSEDGSTAVIGGPVDASYTGATWVNILVPDLIVTASDNGASPNHLLQRGGTGAFTITVSNTGGGPTNATVTVAATLPSGLTATGMSGTGWTCTLGTATCTRSDALAAGSSYHAITLTVNVSATTSATTLSTSFAVSGGGETNTGNDTAADLVTLPVVADLVVSVSHSGVLYKGRTGVPYTILVSNLGAGPTSGQVNVSDTLPSGLINLNIATSQNGWSCSGGVTVTCYRNDVLLGASAYPAITFTVDVSGTFSGIVITNSATVSGGGEVNTGNDTGSDVAHVAASGAGLGISLSHIGNFIKGQTGTYVMIVTNNGGGPTGGTVSVTDNLPGGLTATAIDGGRGWNCSLSGFSILGIQLIPPVTCTRKDPLLPGLSYHFITVTVSVTGGPGTVTNSASVSGGSTTGSTATDSTPIVTQ